MRDESMGTDKEEHVVAYVSYDKITHWKQLMDPGVGEQYPYLYGSNDKNVFHKHVEPGTILWVLGGVIHGRPPSLLAKLTVFDRADSPNVEIYGVPKKVLKVFQKLYKYIAVGDAKHSRFYGYNNAGPALLSMKFKWVHNPPRTLSGESPCPAGTCKWHHTFSIPLQNPARIIGDPQPLLDLDRKSAYTIFISWKLCDHKRRQTKVKQLASALADAGLYVWLDGLALPTSRSLQYNVLKDPALLERLLWNGFIDCKGLLALETRNYGEPGISGNWTEMEWKGEFADKPVCPRPFRAVYRIESSETSSNLVHDRDFFRIGIDWPELASEIKNEMSARFPIE